MSDVSFDEEPTYQHAAGPTKKVGGISAFLIRNKIVKDARGAQYVLLGTAVVAIIATIVILTGSNKTASTPHPLPVPPGVVLPSPGAQSTIKQ